MTRKLLATACLFTACLVAACGGGEAPNINAGQPAPAFVTEQLAGGQIRFPDELRGKPVVIRFWADWCRFCEEEMKAIQRVWQRRQGEGLQILAVNAGQDRATVDAFIRKIGVGYPALLDPPSAIARSYGVVGLPTTFFIDRNGVVRGKVVGEADEATFDRLAGEIAK